MISDIADIKRRLPLPELLAKIGDAAHAKKSCLCPFHEDTHPSFSVFQGNGDWRWKCQTGCGQGDGIDYLAKREGLSKGDAIRRYGELAGMNGAPASKSFRKTASGNGNGKAESNGHSKLGRIIATYDYTDQNGKLLFQVLRYDTIPKTFRQRRPDGKGGWIWKLDGVERVLFRLPEVIRDVKRGLPILLVAGEKDVLALVAPERGFGATCNPGGEGKGKWLDSYTETLRGADVIIIADKDKVGREHAALVAGSLHGVAKTVKVIELPDVGGKAVKDSADYFDAGGDVGDLIGLIDSAPEWAPTQTETPNKNRAEYLPDETEQAPSPKARPIGSFVAPRPDDGQELIRNRYLCRGAGALLVGQSGEGKSSFALQLSMLLGIGKPCFGIMPQHPLRVLVVQSENDEGDLYEMFHGICEGLQLAEAERQRAGEAVLLFCEDSKSGDAFLRGVVEPLVEPWSDLLARIGRIGNRIGQQKRKVQGRSAGAGSFGRGNPSERPAPKGK